MLHSLRLRLLMAVMLVVAVAISLVSLFAGTFTNRLFRAYAMDRVERDHLVAARMLEDAGAAGQLFNVQVRAEELSQAMGSQIVVIDNHGDVLVDSQGTLIGRTLPVPQLYLATPDATAIWAAAQPVTFSGDPPLVLVVGGPDPSIQPFTQELPAAGQRVTFQPAFAATWTTVADRPWSGSLNRGFMWAAGASGLAALGLGLVLSRRIVGPVEALTAAARRMEQGDLTQRVQVRTKDEIGELGHAFNAMAASLGRLEHLRRTMVADIAHELRTPLSNIRGYLEAVRDRVVQPEPAVIASLYEEAMLLSRLVEDLQELALADTGQLRLSPAPMELPSLIERTATAFRPQLVAKNIQLTLNVPADLQPVPADAERIGQVLRNLLTNALQHTPPGGRITLQARPDSSSVEVSVHNTGDGVPLEHLPFVFERFYRADPSRTRATGGAGLGLAVVRQIVEAHGGRAWATSEPGASATFTFSLPSNTP